MEKLQEHSVGAMRCRNLNNDTLHPALPFTRCFHSLNPHNTPREEGKATLTSPHLTAEEVSAGSDVRGRDEFGERSPACYTFASPSVGRRPAQQHRLEAWEKRSPLQALPPA